MSLMQLASMATATARNSSHAMPFMDVPSNLLETFIPGYSSIVQFILERFRIDINSIVTISLFAFALGRSASYLKDRILTTLMQHGTCSVTIPADGDQYLWIMAWLADRGIGANSSHLTAVSPRRRMPTYGRMRRGYIHCPDPDISTSRGTPQEQDYEPCLSQTQYFWHRGRLFRWHRKHDGGVVEFPLSGLISCVTYSTTPIKQLIEEAKTSYNQNMSQRTTVRRPSPRARRDMGHNIWRVVSSRPSRPLSTVVLGCDQKDKLVQDIEEYLKPESREWYAMRGIPYRRGYLLHGPCGTGKSSLAFGIAGKFDLDVYCISLAEPSINEEDLAALFDELPENCLVLLEDVDSAGLVDRATKAAHADGVPQPHMFDFNRASNSISLSGLLNVIDGVASHEGRVLIMTTNRIDALDSALLRPGRVDVRIRFDLATRRQAKDLFLQTFLDGMLASGNSEERPTWTRDDLTDMAYDFADMIPDHALSPAELQGFLLNWRHEPKEAVARAKEWVSEAMKEKLARFYAKQVNGIPVPTPPKQVNGVNGIPMPTSPKQVNGMTTPSLFIGNS